MRELLKRQEVFTKYSHRDPKHHEYNRISEGKFVDMVYEALLLQGQPKNDKTFQLARTEAQKVWSLALLLLLLFGEHFVLLG